MPFDGGNRLSFVNHLQTVIVFHSVDEGVKRWHGEPQKGGAVGPTSVYTAFRVVASGCRTLVARPLDPLYRDSHSLVRAWVPAFT
jgi:hypothetical protein